MKLYSATCLFISLCTTTPGDAIPSPTPSPSPSPAPFPAGTAVIFEGSFHLRKTELTPDASVEQIEAQLRQELSDSGEIEVKVKVTPQTTASSEVQVGKRRLSSDLYVVYWAKMKNAFAALAKAKLENLCESTTMKNGLSTAVNGQIALDSCEVRELSKAPTRNQCEAAPKKFRVAPLYLSKKKQIIGYPEDTSFCPEYFPTTLASFKNTVAAAAAITTPPLGMAGSRTLSVRNFNLDFSSDDFQCVHEADEIKLRVRETMTNPVNFQLDHTHCRMKDISIYNTGKSDSTITYNRDGGMLGVRFDFECTGVNTFGQRTHVAKTASINLELKEENFLEAQKVTSPDFTSFFKAICTKGGRKTYFKPNLLNTEAIAAKNSQQPCFATQANVLHIFSQTSCFPDFIWIDLLKNNKLAAIMAQTEVIKAMLPPATSAMWVNPLSPPAPQTCATTCNIIGSFSVTNAGLSKEQVEAASKQTLTQVLGVPMTSVVAKWHVETVHVMYWSVSYKMVANLAAIEKKVPAAIDFLNIYKQKLPASKAASTTVGHFQAPVMEPVAVEAKPNSANTLRTVPATVMADHACVCFKEMECSNKCQCSNKPPAGQPTPWFSTPLKSPFPAANGFDLTLTPAEETALWQ